MTDLELHDWAFARYGSEDLANKLAIVQQLHRDHPDDPSPLLDVPDVPPRSEISITPRDRRFPLRRFP
jgi:hypothetical protein